MDNYNEGMNMDAFFLALLTACIWGSVPFLEKIGLASVSPTTAYVVRSSGVFLGVLIVVFTTNNFSSIGKMELKPIVVLVLAGILAGFVAQVVFFKAIKSGEISRVVPITSCAPLVTFFLGWIFLGEEVTVSKITGVVLIIGGLIFLKL